MSEKFNTPILFLFFNRPDTTLTVFEKIITLKPSKLFLASDGPRYNISNEDEVVKMLRIKILSLINWDCDLQILFRDNNLGCKEAVSSSITWFFSSVEYGIILEDDVLPDPTFFSYCEKLLIKYKDNDNIGMISGSNLVPHASKNFHYSYYFTNYNLIWGWATWRRVWNRYDVNLSSWPSNKHIFFKGKKFKVKYYWSFIFQNVYEHNIDTWDYQFTYCCWLNNYISIIPSVNLTLNIGFGKSATHTTGNPPNYFKNLELNKIDFPLIHPNNLLVNKKNDSLIEKQIFDINFINFVILYLNRNKIISPIYKKLKYLIKNA